jgi:hypothetical protein
LVKEDPRLGELVERLRAAHGEHLRSVVLYGGAVDGANPIALTGYRALVVLDHIRPVDLRAAHSVVEAWTEAGNPPPVYFTASEMADASDVFPIEFLDMMYNRRVLYGADPFEGLDVPTRNLRHQVEFELRGNLIRLRELYIPVSSSAVTLTGLLVESLGTFAKLFRFALHLVDVEDRGTRRETIDRAVARFELDPAPFERILSALDTGRAMAEADAHECFAAYIAQIERVVDAVDRIPNA